MPKSHAPAPSPPLPSQFPQRKAKGVGGVGLFPVDSGSNIPSLWTGPPVCCLVVRVNERQIRSDIGRSWVQRAARNDPSTQKKTHSLAPSVSHTWSAPQGWPMGPRDAQDRGLCHGWSQKIERGGWAQRSGEERDKELVRVPGPCQALRCGPSFPLVVLFPVPPSLLTPAPQKTTNLKCPL